MIILIVIHSFEIIIFAENEMGKINTISISNIKKIRAIKKKWIENGIRADESAENPHSNCDLFSRSIIDFFEIKNVIVDNAIKIILIITMNFKGLIVFSDF